MAKKQKEPKKEKSPKSQFKKTLEQINTSVVEETEESFEEENDENSEKPSSIFVPKETNPTHKSNLLFFSSMRVDILKAFVLMIEESYYHLKTTWEQEDRITKQRKECLQIQYDKIKDIKTIIKTKSPKQLFNLKIKLAVLKKGSNFRV